MQTPHFCVVVWKPLQKVKAAETSPLQAADYHITAAAVTKV